MTIDAILINLEYEDKLLFATEVPEWSTQHEMKSNNSTSWVRYPSPKAWDWLRLPLSEDFNIVGLSTPNGFRTPDGDFLKNGHEIFGTLIRSHIVTNAKKYNVLYKESNVYLILEMFFK